MISEASNPIEKIELQNQLGAVSRARHASSQEQSDVQKAQEAFEQANELYRSLPPEQQGGRAGGIQVVALCTAAVAAREANDHEKSATLFRSARELFQASQDSAMFAASVGYDLESITNQEMNQWIRVKKETDALKCLEILSTLPSPRWAPSYYALNYAALRYEKDSKGFQSFVSKWLDTNAFDDRTPILMARLGFSYFDSELYEKALPIYETLRDKHRSDFQRLEPEAFKQGNGGHYERVLFHLAHVYAQQGDVGKAESVKTELTTLLPDSTLGKFLTDSGISPSEEAWISPERPRYLALRIFLFVASIIVISWGLYLLWTKEKEKA